MKLIVYPHGIGDIVMALPALKALKGEHALGMIWRILDDNMRIPFIDKYHWLSNPWDDFQDYENGLLGVQNEAKAIVKKQGYDEAIFCPMIMSNDHGQRAPYHRAERAAMELGLNPPDIDFTECIKLIGRPFRENLKGKKVAVVHGKGGRESKLLTPELVSKTIEELKGLGYYVVALETHTGFKWSDKHKSIGAPDLTTATLERFDLQELAGLAVHTDLFIGIDSGPLHIMSTMGVKSVGIFIDTWAHQSAPLQKNADIVFSRQARALCAPEWIEKNLDRCIFESNDEVRWETIKRAIRE